MLDLLVWFAGTHFLQCYRFTLCTYTCHRARLCPCAGRLQVASRRSRRGSGHCKGGAGQLVCYLHAGLPSLSHRSCFGLHAFVLCLTMYETYYLASLNGRGYAAGPVTVPVPVCWLSACLATKMQVVCTSACVGLYHASVYLAGWLDCCGLICRVCLGYLLKGSTLISPAGTSFVYVYVFTCDVAVLADA